MKNVRNCLFETNSSSVHSVSIRFRKGYIEDCDFKSITLGDYEWGYDELEEPDEKLSYLFTYAIIRLMYYSKKELRIDFCKKYFPVDNPDEPLKDDELLSDRFDYYFFNASTKLKFVERLNHYIHTGDDSDFKDFSEFKHFKDLVDFVKEHCSDFKNFCLIPIERFNVDHQSCEDYPVDIVYKDIGLDSLIFNSKYVITIFTDNY